MVDFCPRCTTQAHVRQIVSIDSSNNAVFVVVYSTLTLPMTTVSTYINFLYVIGVYANSAYVNFAYAPNVEASNRKNRFFLWFFSD